MLSVSFAGVILPDCGMSRDTMAEDSKWINQSAEVSHVFSKKFPSMPNIKAGPQLLQNESIRCAVVLDIRPCSYAEVTL
jgi:hypothetical protein